MNRWKLNLKPNLLSVIAPAILFLLTACSGNNERIDRMRSVVDDLNQEWALDSVRQANPAISNFKAELRNDTIVALYEFMPYVNFDALSEAGKVELEATLRQAVTEQLSAEDISAITNSSSKSMIIRIVMRDAHSNSLVFDFDCAKKQH